MKARSRANELTAVLGRERFDELPGGVDDPKEAARWLAFRAAYHRAAEGLVEPEAFPLQVDFELNSTCNIACAFCLHGVEKVERRELSFESFAKVIDEGERYGLCSVKLNYINEPLIRRDLPRFVRYARERGVLNVYFATNGILLSREVARELIDAGVSKVLVSLDAATPETFRSIRNSDRYEAIVENILGLLALREELGTGAPLVRVNFLRTPQNAHEADAFVERWTGVADMIGFQDRVNLPGVDPDLFGPGVGRSSPETFRCSMPFKLVVIDSSGAILPCCTFAGRSMPIGHVDETTIAEAWRVAEIEALRRTHRGAGYRGNPLCLQCVGATE